MKEEVIDEAVEETPITPDEESDQEGTESPSEEIPAEAEPEPAPTPEPKPLETDGSPVEMNGPATDCGNGVEAREGGYYAAGMSISPGVTALQVFTVLQHLVKNPTTMDWMVAKSRIAQEVAGSLKD